MYELIAECLFVLAFGIALGGLLIAIQRRYYPSLTEEQFGLFYLVSMSLLVIAAVTGAILMFGGVV